ncbi:TetR/AcrR family transcriptional regulator [Gloeothece verrucosa]|uniref:Transcriptional regulator, TetR family n=1 Tax=Gloeothece verrucosa (strain PCC 7822) TaxID=497965 RepID=E0UJF6_GLOV7|nr:TetR/AcrR family transcriptional regulator [Gloeothece verrucosa]ADN16974.1 transcriptional regulator, TetR family [Gloeothece verrucosa PCC 7822]
MARHKEFNQQEALSKAMETFWRYGYEGTSIQDLVESMGINRGSLYDTFGDKRSLFLAAIAHYDETVVQNLVSRLEDPKASKQAIIDYFYNLIERTVNDQSRRGCFLINTAVELCPHDLEAQQHIATNLQRIENAFYQALDRAMQKGEISQNKDIRALARYLTCLMQGIRVFSKVNSNRDALKDIVQTGLIALD